jgi:hypothetical protein
MSLPTTWTPVEASLSLDLPSRRAAAVFKDERAMFGFLAEESAATYVYSFCLILVSRVLILFRFMLIATFLSAPRVMPSQVATRTGTL